jgi:ribonuclease BN (tRNA processing enzyme)
VLVSEIVDLDSIRAGLVAVGTTGAALDTLMAHMEFQHLTPEKLGQMAQEAGVKTVVLTHFVAGRHFDPQSLVAALGRSFKGRIVPGKDLDVIPLG